MGHLYRIMRRYIGLVIGVIFFMTLGAMGDLLLPNLSRAILDRGILQNDFDTIWQTGLLMIAVSFGIIAVAFTGHFLDARLGAFFARDLRDQLFQKTMKFSQQEFDHLSSSSLITRTTNDVNQVQQFFMIILRMGVRAPAMAIGGIVMSYTLSPTLTLILGGGVAFLAIIITIVASKLTPFSLRVQKSIDRINEVLREKLSGVRVIRAFNTVEFERERFTKASNELRSVSVFLNRIQALFNPTFNLVINITILALIFFGKDFISSGELTLGSLTAILSYTQMILFSVIMLTMLMMMLPRALAAMKRIGEVLDEPLAIQDVHSDAPYANSSGVVAFNDVTFRYPLSSKDVLSHLSFEVKPGTTTAIIGSTGSGKSTIAKLLLRFYDVTQGQIAYNGTDIRQLTLKTLHADFGYVPQKPSLFSGTIASNIGYGVDQLEESLMKEVSEVAQASEFIAEKEGHYEAEVSQGATNFSGGQKQRLSIARALAKRPKLFIFDDAFSALDYRTDVKVREALKKYAKDASVLVIAQRVNTIRHAEQILVLDDGKIVGRGTHEELMATNTTYQEIVYSQLSKEEAVYEHN